MRNVIELEKLCPTLFVTSTVVMTSLLCLNSKEKKYRHTIQPQELGDVLHGIQVIKAVNDNFIQESG